MSAGISTKKFYDDQEREETEQENEENENESSIDVQNKDTSETLRIPEITTEELQTAINRLKKKGKSADSNGIRAEDIKTCDDETKEMVRYTKKRRRGRCWKLPPDLFFASVVQTVHDSR